MRILLAMVSVMSLIASAIEIPVNTCVVSGSVDRNPAESSSIDFSGGLDSCWRDVEDIVADAAFHPRKPVAMQIVIR